MIGEKEGDGPRGSESSAMMLVRAVSGMDASSPSVCRVGNHERPVEHVLKAQAGVGPALSGIWSTDHYSSYARWVEVLCNFFITRRMCSTLWGERERGIVVGVYVSSHRKLIGHSGCCRSLVSCPAPPPPHVGKIEGRRVWKIALLLRVSPQECLRS